MKMTRFIIVVQLFFALLTGSMAKAESPESDKTLAPYFLIQSESTDVEQFPLLSAKSDVNIVGVIADVSVTQTYKNDGQNAIEAIYVFPGSTRSAVYGMKMIVGERVIEAKIKEKQAAKQEYQEAKKEGKTASLLEQERPNVFQMNVANILPGDKIVVELRYTELLIPADGVYEFVYPTVVGPRYSNQKASDAKEKDKWVANPYLSEGTSPPYTFDMNLRISTGVPVQEMTCSSHKANIQYESKSSAILQLDDSEKTGGGNRDFILKYRLTGGKIESGLLLYSGKDENFFLLMVQPPKQIAPEVIPPREYIFIVDVSGSMHGFPLQISKKLMEDLLYNLRQTDMFNLLFFAGSSAAMEERSVPATPDNIKKAVNMILRQRGSGGTELLTALKHALSLPKTEGVSRTIVIATDGYVNVETQAFDLIRNNLNNANMFAFGIGSSVNRFIIEGMAHVGAGEPFVIIKPDDAEAEAEKFRRYILSPVLTDIKIEFNGFESYDTEPVSIPDVLAERPVILFGKWKGEAKGEIHVKGISGINPYIQTFNVSNVKPADGNAALRYLWARKRIEILGDYNDLTANSEYQKEILTLGLTYNLLTDYTSFIAVDQIIRRQSDMPSDTVKQPLPLPQGVSNLAVSKNANTITAKKAKGKNAGQFSGGGGGNPEPEPATLLLLGTGIVGLWILKRKKRL